MKTLVIVGSLVIGLATGTAFARDVASPPTKVSAIGFYGCSVHPQVQATWPARCPICQTVLPAALPSASTDLGATAAIDRNDRRRDENAGARNRNQELREQARRHEQLRERARRDEELRERYRYDRHAYPPRRYHYDYPPRRYYYDYSPYGRYHYNPRTGHYYYPNSGYYYSPDTGQYYYSNPGYSYPNNGHSYPPG